MRSLETIVCFSEITTQPLRVGLRVRQGDVAVRPDEIERRALETGSPHPRLPGEEVERKLKFGACGARSKMPAPQRISAPRLE
jgi:hypothetical protein